MVLKLIGHLINMILMSVIPIHGVPPNYCLHPMNRSDCGGPPTPVFSYYKPGSRCEIEIWRGCPSYNRFDNEITCSHVCIMKLRFDADNEVPDESFCNSKLNRGDCGSSPTMVYTYNQNTERCEKAVWKGCKTLNMFRYENKCMKECMPIQNLADWESEMKKLSGSDIKKIDTILDQLIDEKNEGLSAHSLDKEENKVLPPNTMPPPVEGSTETKAEDTTKAEVQNLEETTEAEVKNLEETTKAEEENLEVTTMGQEDAVDQVDETIGI